MKQTVLDRYEKTPGNAIIIDVAATQVEDLYNNYDNAAPYVRRDLEQDLVDYLIDSAKEIVPRPFVIQFSLTNAPDKSKQSRVRGSINAYFMYLEDVERDKVAQMFRRSAALFGIGLLILFLSVFLYEVIGEEGSILANVIAEGVNIAAWVALWESLAILVLEWLPQQKHLRLYKRLANAELIFKQRSIF